MRATGCVAFCCVFVLSVFSIPSWAALPAMQVNSTVNLRMLDVAAPTWQALGPVFAARIKQHAFGLGQASYRVNWKLDTRQVGVLCRISGVTVSLNATVMLPRWLQRANATRYDRQRWDTLVGGVLDYEWHHRERMQQGANEIGQALARVAPMSSCSALEQAAWQAGQRELVKINEELEQYRRQTNNGLTLGIDWPS